MCSKASSNWAISEHVASDQVISFFSNKNILSVWPGFCFAIETDVAFLNLNFRSVSGLLLDHYIITLICFSHCMSFVKIFANCNLG